MATPTQSYRVASLLFVSSSSKLLKRKRPSGHLASLLKQPIRCFFQNSRPCFSLSFRKRIIMSSSSASTGDQTMDPTASAVAAAAEAADEKPVESSIRRKIAAAFASTDNGLVHLDVMNESYKHNVAPGSESHFNLLVVSDVFEGMKLIERHRYINNILREELGKETSQGGIHALGIQAKTVAQWQADPSLQGTPNCMGGSKR